MDIDSPSGSATSPSGSLTPGADAARLLRELQAFLVSLQFANTDSVGTNATGASATPARLPGASTCEPPEGGS